MPPPNSPSIKKSPKSNNVLRSRSLGFSFRIQILTLVIAAIAISFASHRKLNASNNNVQTYVRVDSDNDTTSVFNDDKKAATLVSHYLRDRTVSVKGIFSRQIINMVARKVNVGDEKVGFQLAMLGPQDLCIPICEDVRAYTQGLVSVAGSYLGEYPCPSNELLSHFFDKEYKPVDSKRLAVVIPNRRFTKKVLEDFLANWGSLRACKNRTNVDLLLMGYKNDIRGMNNFNLLYECFRDIRILESRSIGEGNEESMLMIDLLNETSLIDDYNYLFWMGSNITLEESHWIHFLELETQDASPFLWKSSLDSNNDPRSYMQGLYGFTPTAYSLRLSKNAIIGIWHKGFNSLFRQLLAGDRSFKPFNDVLSTFVFGKICHIKYFWHYIRYVKFSTYSSGKRVLSPAERAGIYFVENREECAYTMSKSLPSDMRFWFSERQLNVPLTWSFLNQLIWEVDPNPLPRFNFWTSNGKELPKAEEDVKALMDSDCIFTAEEKLSFPLDHAVVSKPRILIAFVFSAKQYSALLYSLARWDFPSFSPCTGQSKDFEAGILFVQSDLVDNSLESRIFHDTNKYKSLSSCFHKTHYKFIALEDGSYMHGPANMFKEFMLGEVSKEYDYVFQMEPDVLPIKSEWLRKLYEETLDNTPFWVKGAVSMYYDLDEMFGGCLNGLATSNANAIELQPLGHSHLHINGNAMYSLDAKFKSIVGDFFMWAETGAGSLCNRTNRMQCSSGHCQGSFDTSLAEYFLLNHQNMQDFWPQYRASSFIMNSVDPEYIPVCFSHNTYFLHKPWHFFQGKQGTQCYQRLKGQLLLNEIEMYLNYGFPPNIMKETTAHGYPDPYMIAKFIQENFPGLM